MKYFLRLLTIATFLGLLDNRCFGAEIEKEPRITRELWVSPVKQQGHTNTCWSFATVGLLESEAHRLGRGDFDLSPIFFAREAYLRKALAFVRSHGENRLDAGGLSHDVLAILRDEGCLPSSAYTGLPTGKTKHAHFEMDALLSGYLHTLVKYGKDDPLSGNWSSGALNSSWLDGFRGILDAYLGAPPASFLYKGKTYTARTFAGEALGLRAADYVEIASSSRWPFYTEGDLLLPDNWMHRPMYNLPIDEFQRVVDHALETGFTLAVSIHKRKIESTNPSKFLHAIDEDLTKEFTQDLRDSLLESWCTEDTHLVQIYGLAVDETGKKFFVTKDSMNPANEPGAEYFNKNYLSVPALRTRVNFLLVHKDALPVDLRDKLGL